MEINGDKLIFSTGRTIYANNGISGSGKTEELADINHSLTSIRLNVYEGYDGYIDEDLSQDEKIELAGFMAARWLEWAGVRQVLADIAEEIRFLGPKKIDAKYFDKKMMLLPDDQQKAICMLIQSALWSKGDSRDDWIATMEAIMEDA